MRNNSKQQMHLTSLQIGVESDLPALIDLIEQCGGNLDTFLKRLPKSQEAIQIFLPRLLRLLDYPHNEKYKQQWNEALRYGKQARLLLLQEKGLSLLEGFQNLSETSNTSEIAFCKFVLPEITAKNKQEPQDSEFDEQAETDREADELLASIEASKTLEEEERAKQELQRRQEQEYQKQYR